MEDEKYCPFPGGLFIFVVLIMKIIKCLGMLNSKRPLITRLIIRPINKIKDSKYDKGEYKTGVSNHNYCFSLLGMGHTLLNTL